MDECKIHSESEEGEIMSDFEEDFTEELHNLPHVLKFIHKLQDHIKRQRKKINKLRNKLNIQVRLKKMIILLSISYYIILTIFFVGFNCYGIKQIY